MDPHLWIDLLGIAACLMGSAFFSGSETALTSLSRSRIEIHVRQHPAKWGVLNAWLNARRRYLATLLIGNNLVNILCSVLAYRLAWRLVPDYAEAISVFGLTIVVLVFAEITPKGIALHHAEKLAVPVMHLVWVVDKLLFPLSYPLSRLPGLFSNAEEHDEDPAPTPDEIRYHIQRGLDEQVFTDTNEGELLKASIDFSDTLVKEIMIPRTDMTCLEADDSLDTALETIVATGHSRVPVYVDTPDNIVGILYAKDLLRHFRTAAFHGDVTVADIMRRDVMYAPETQHISPLLTDMRRRSFHLAVVVDEFGGTAGIVTMEDIIEELVGDIHDEHDVDEHEIREVEPGRWVVDGRISIEDFQERTGCAIPDEGEYESIGGFVVWVFGRIPKRGKSRQIAGLHLTVIDADKRRVKVVEIRRVSGDGESRS